LLLSGMRGVTWNAELQQGSGGNSPAKIAGNWLGEHYHQDLTVMTAGDSRVAFYAGATLNFLPYTQSAVALRYIQLKNPSFIVLNEMEVWKRPYLRDWMENGIPDPHAKSVFDTRRSPRIVVYEWKR
jgi:hypothetical protein